MNLPALVANARHSALYMALCAAATALAAWALWSSFTQRPRRGVLWAAAGVLALALGGSVWDTYAQRASVVPTRGACGPQRAQDDAYEEAQWNSRLAFAFVPATILLLVAMARARRTSVLVRTVAASTPLVLLVWNARLFHEVAPGHDVLYSGVCRFWDVRDEIRAGDPTRLRSGCSDLQNILDPKRYEYAKDPALLARALPELDALRSQCLDLLARDVEAERERGRTTPIAEYLDNPLLEPGNRATFAARLNAIDRSIPDVRCSSSHAMGRADICIGSRAPADVTGADAETAVRVRFAIRWVAQQITECLMQRAFNHDGVFRFTLAGTIASDGAMRDGSVMDVDGLDERNGRKLVACGSDVLTSFQMRSASAGGLSIRYRLWGAAPGVDGSH